MLMLILDNVVDDDVDVDIAVPPRGCLGARVGMLMLMLMLMMLMLMMLMLMMLLMMLMLMLMMKHGFGCVEHWDPAPPGAPGLG